jgi:hypothetical protein
LAKQGDYKVFAAVYHIPPPDAKIKLERMAIFDKKGRFIEGRLGGTLDWYEGRYSKKMARQVVAADYEVIGYAVTEKDVELVSAEEVERLEEHAKQGGFQIHVFAKNVPAEKTLYLEGIYRLDNAVRASPETRVMDFIQTQGDEREEGLKALVSTYLKQRFDYDVEPEEIFFLNGKGRKAFEKMTEEYDLRP